MYGNVTNCWITLNRACNLDCKWCYAKNTSCYQTMTLNDVNKILEFLPNIGVKQITLMGGEPSIYRDIREVISNAHRLGIKIGMVTNGIALADESYVNELIDYGLTSIGLSLKGYDQDSFINTTGKDYYLSVLKAIQNIARAGLPFSVSFVLTKENISRIHRGILDAKDAGASRFRLAFCYDFEACRTKRKAVDNPYEIAGLFMDCYHNINAASNGNFSLFQNLPLCVWNNDFIEMLESRGQIKSICQLLSKSGLIFDTDLSIIPCNAMYDYKIGRFGIDFVDGVTFDKFWNREDIVSFYNRLRAVPDEECLSCSSYSKCGGGCVANWFNYSFDDLKSMKSEN